MRSLQSTTISGVYSCEAFSQAIQVFLHPSWQYFVQLEMPKYPHDAKKNSVSIPRPKISGDIFTATGHVYVPLAWPGLPSAVLERFAPSLQRRRFVYGTTNKPTRCIIVRLGFKLRQAHPLHWPRPTSQQFHPPTANTLPPPTQGDNRNA